MALAHNTIGERPLKNSPSKLSPRKKEVLDFIFSKQDAGASAKEVAANLKIHLQRAASIVHGLERIGEVFTKGGGVHYSTAWALASDPKPLVKFLHGELERALEDSNDPPERVFDFIEKYRAARNLGLTRHEAWRCTHQRLMKSMEGGHG